MVFKDQCLRTKVSRKPFFAKSFPGVWWNPLEEAKVSFPRLATQCVPPAMAGRRDGQRYDHHDSWAMANGVTEWSGT